MKNNNQSSIEWLYDQMSNIAAGYTTELNQQEILEQAKAMHEHEVKDGYNVGYRDGESDGVNLCGNENDIEQYSNAQNYYNETFKECKD